VVIHLRVGLVAEQAVRQFAPRSHGDRGQRLVHGDVTHGMDARYIGVLPGADDDMPAVIGLDADAVQAQRFGVGHPTDRP
jgi:hypothetical protein